MTVGTAPVLPVLEPPEASQPASTNPANQIAKQLTGRDYVSWSALSTFRQCPLKYRFRYIDGLPEESVSSALVFGTGIHAAVGQHLQAMLSGDRQPIREQFMFAYRSAWLPHDPDQIQSSRSENRASLDGLAGRMLAAFPASPAASEHGRVLGAGEEIRGMLVGGVPDLHGRVNLLTEDHDRITITDIKTSRGTWSADQSGVFYAAPSLVGCSGCGHRAACRAWAGERVAGRENGGAGGETSRAASFRCQGVGG